MRYGPEAPAVKKLVNSIQLPDQIIRISFPREAHDDAVVS